MASVEINFKSLKSPFKQCSKTPPTENALVSIKSMYLNATSLDNKLDEFKLVVNTYQPMLIGVSETWFKSFSIVNLPNYNIYRRDRSDGRRGGGVCIYI